MYKIEEKFQAFLEITKNGWVNDTYWLNLQIQVIILHNKYKKRRNKKKKKNTWSYLIQIQILMILAQCKAKNLKLLKAALELNAFGLKLCDQLYVGDSAEERGW